MAHVKPVHKTREDDVIECFLYPKFCYTMNTDQITEEVLGEEISKYNQELASYLNDYIWHNDSLIFRPRTKQALLLDKVFQGSTYVDDYHVLPHIYVSLRFDEDIGDEWFTVFLVYKLTEAFEGLIARVVDADGEFLLIEAANALPRWANPDTCQDRVFIYEGQLHIIRDREKPLFTVLNNLYKSPHFYKMSDEVQAALNKRIGIYPEECKKRKHKARAFLPDKAASILKQEEGLIAAAIRTICHSDPLERKVCRAMRYFPPEQRTMVNVKMTKCLYAMVTHCRYTGDPRTGWNLPPTNSSMYNSYVLGVKIACGLEMLVARANEERRKARSDRAEEEDAEKIKANQHALNAYLTRLEVCGYFRNTLESSQEREQLLLAAKNYFLKHADPLYDFKDFDKNDAERVLEAWETVQTNDIRMHEDEADLSPADSDSWMVVDPTQLETYLNQQYGTDKNKRSEQEPLSLRERVQAFLNQSSDVDGVQFLGDESSDHDTRQDQDDNGKIEFDLDVFDTALKDMLDLVVPGGEGEFEGSSEDSLGGEDEDRGGEMGKYMQLLDSELQGEMVMTRDNRDRESRDLVETNLRESIQAEAGGSGPVGNIMGGPVRRLMHLQLQSPTSVPPDLQS